MSLLIVTKSFHFDMYLTNYSPDKLRTKEIRKYFSGVPAYVCNSFPFTSNENKIARNA